MEEGYWIGLLAAVALVIAAGFWKYWKSRTETVTEEDIRTMVNEGHEQGVLESSEAEMISNIFEFNDKQAQDIMTHRKNVVALDGSISLREAARFVLKEAKNSRFPVFGEDLDDIIGTVHIRDILVHAENPDEAHRPLAQTEGVLRAPCFIPETRNINSLFKEMQSKKIHMEIVIDEYGQTTGIVTMEDILEEIVGNILDEYDVDEQYITRDSGGALILRGMAPLEEVQEALQVRFPEDDLENFDTVNGLMISLLGRIPEEDEQPAIPYLGYLFFVLKVENKMIQSVRVTKA